MNQWLQRMIDKYPDLEPILPDVEQAYGLLEACFRAGHKVLICGNGGSAADSEHVVGELMKGYLSARPLPEAQRRQLIEAFPETGAYLAERLQGGLPAISLVSHTALLTAIANDIAGDLIFAQQVVGFGQPGDVLMGISTSGNSKNVLYALQVARVRGLGTLGVTGRGGSAMRALCDVTVGVPFERTADIQERHLAIYHAVCAMIEEALFPP